MKEHLNFHYNCIMPLTKCKAQTVTFHHARSCVCNNIYLENYMVHYQIHTALIYIESKWKLHSYTNSHKIFGSCSFYNEWLCFGWQNYTTLNVLLSFSSSSSKFCFNFHVRRTTYIQCMSFSPTHFTLHQCCYISYWKYLILRVPILLLPFYI